MRPRPLGSALVPALMLMLAGACTSDPAAFGEAVAVDGPLPAIEGPWLGRGDSDPPDAQGRVTVVNVWATWCTPCRREQPVLQDAWEAYRDRGVAFVGINYRDDPAAAQEWVREFEVTYPSVIDEDGSYAAELGFTGLPATYVADDGALRYRFYGEITREELTDVLDDVLSRTPA